MRLNLRCFRDDTCSVELAGCRIALGMLAATCTPVVVDDTLAALRYLAEHNPRNRDAHLAAVAELALIASVLDEIKQEGD